MGEQFQLALQILFFPIRTGLSTGVFYPDDRPTAVEPVPAADHPGPIPTVRPDQMTTHIKLQGTDSDRFESIKCQLNTTLNDSLANADVIDLLVAEYAAKEVNGADQERADRDRE